MKGKSLFMILAIMVFCSGVFTLFSSSRQATPEPTMSTPTKIIRTFTPVPIFDFTTVTPAATPTKIPYKQIGAVELFTYPEKYLYKYVMVQSRVSIASSKLIVLVSGGELCYIYPKSLFDGVYDGNWVTIKGRMDKGIAWNTCIMKEAEVMK